jgi:hypothetical protein
MSNLYAYKTIFSIDSIAALDDFWSFLIFRLNLEQSQYTYDRFARLYNLLSEHKHKLSEQDVVYIILEESSDKYFISIDTTITELLEHITSRLKALKFTYLSESNLLSYTIDKKKTVSNEALNDSSALKTYNYTFMDLQDLDEMQNILEKMYEKNYEQISPSLTAQELNDYRSTFSYYSSYLKYYAQLSTVNNIVAELSVLLSLYSKECLNLGNDFRLILSSFLNNLIHWQEKLFIKGTEELDFMDNSLKADLSQIKIVLNLYDEQSLVDEDTFMDDIFDF